DGGGTLAALEDFFQGLEACGFARVCAETELGVVHDGRQDVVEFVGHAGCQRADAAEPLGAEKLFAKLFRFRCGGNHFLADHRGRLPLKDEGGRMKVEKVNWWFHPSSFILHPCSCEGIGRAERGTSSEVLVIQPIKAIDWAALEGWATMAGWRRC